MRMIKRELLLCPILTAFVFVCALAWGSPFLSIGSGSRAAYAQSQTRAAQVEGTILRSGDQFLLRDASGQLFRLDGTQQVEPFEGKAVTITGQFDQQNKTVHVEQIESATV